MAKRTPAAAPVDEQLNQFETGLGQTDGVPRNLGNFPDDLTPPAPGTVAASPADDAPPVAEADAPPAAVRAEPETPEVSPEPDTAPAASDDDRLAELDPRIEAMRRENEFLRLAAQRQAAPAQPQSPLAVIDQVLGGFQVTPEDVQTILADPTKGAEYLMNGLRAAIAAGATLATQQLRQEFAQWQQATHGQNEAGRYFWGKNPDLAQYNELVQVAWAQVAEDPLYPSIQAKGDETARRVRGRLREWGVTPARAAGPRSVTAVRPARGEMGGNRGAGARAMSAQEKQLRSFESGLRAANGR